MDVQSGGGWGQAPICHCFATSFLRRGPRMLLVRRQRLKNKQAPAPTKSHVSELNGCSFQTRMYGKLFTEEKKCVC